MVTTLETITPEKAREYLSNKAPNRTIRAKDVAMLVRDIQNGEWRVTHQGIAFNNAGELIDGQHRLLACVKSGIPINILVTRGLEDGAGAAIDRGKTRIFADTLAIEKKYENKPHFRSNTIASAVRTLVRAQYNGSIKLSDAEILAIMTRFDKDCLIAYKAVATGNKQLPALPPQRWRQV